MLKTRTGRILRHTFSRLLLRTVRRNTIRKVEMDQCVNPFGLSFGQDGWHFLVEYLRELHFTHTLSLNESILYHYHKQYQPVSMKELVTSAGMHVEFDPGFLRYPWGNFKTDFDHRLAEKDRFRSRFCGPSDDELIKAEARNLVELRDYMKCTGYNPWKSPYGFIGGVFLVKENADYRFVILQGNHRVSVMSYLGIKCFEVRFLPYHFHYIDQKDIDEWYYVKRGICTKQDARKYFDAFFILNGKERASSFCNIDGTKKDNN